VSTSTVPSPTFGYLYPSTSLAGITCVSSRWEVLKAFLASSDGALVSRLRELSTGLLFITSIPGQAHSGAIYFYSSVRRAFFMLDWAGRDDDFEAADFDVLVEAFSLDLALAPGACPLPATTPAAMDETGSITRELRVGCSSAATSTSGAT